MIGRFVALVLLGWALGFAAFMLTLPEPAGGDRTDAIVVPTGAAGRINRGISLLEQDAARAMLVTGVDPDVTRGEFAAAYRVPRRLMACCVELGSEAVDTRSNADETAAWVRARRYRTVRVVTSDWHMPRTRMELANALGDDAETIADPVRGSPRFGLLVNEYNKFLVRWIVLTFGIDI